MPTRYNNPSVSTNPEGTAALSRKLLLFLEYAILIFTGFCIIWYALYVIVPFVNFALKNPLRQTVRILRYIGVILTVLNLVFARRLRKAPGVFCMYGICAVAAVSSLARLEYGYRSNMVTIQWMLTLSCLFYGALFRMNRRKLLGFVTVTYMFLLVIWSVASCLSLAQFVLQIGEDGPNYASTPWLGGVGFARHRLFGVFGYPEYGSVTGLMLLIIGAYYFVRLRSRFVRVFIILFSLPFFPYIVISGSRNAALAFGVVLFTGTLLFLWKNREPALQRNFRFSLCAAAASVVIFLILYAGTRQIASFLPPLFSGTQAEEGEARQPDEGMRSLATGSRAPVVSYKLDTSVNDAAADNSPVPLVSLVSFVKKASIIESHNEPSAKYLAKNTDSAETDEDKEEDTDKEADADKENAQEEEGILSRRYKGGEISNGRRDIWSNYLSMYREIGLIGFSPENAGFVIQKIHPELYICRIIRRHQPELYETGYVYHTHSGYLRVFVSTGFLGLALLIIFIVRCAYAVIRQILRSRSLSPEFLFSLLVVMTGAITAMFDNEVFFNMNPESLIFWAALGILMKSALAVPKRGSSHRASFN